MSEWFFFFLFPPLKITLEIWGYSSCMSMAYTQVFMVITIFTHTACKNFERNLANQKCDIIIHINWNTFRNNNFYCNLVNRTGNHDWLSWMLSQLIWCCAIPLWFLCCKGSHRRAFFINNWMARAAASSFDVCFLPLDAQNSLLHSSEPQPSVSWKK